MTVKGTVAKGESEVYGIKFVFVGTNQRHGNRRHTRHGVYMRAYVTGGR